MKPYSVDLREKIVNDYQAGNISVRKLAANFSVAKSFVQKMLKQHKETGHVNPEKQGTKKKAVLASSSSQLIELVAKYPDATLSEYCEYWLESYEQLVSPSMMCRELQKLNLTRKKKTVWSSQTATDRVQLLRYEYREKVRDIDHKNMVFLDEMSLLLGLIRDHARSEKGSRAYDSKPFYRGAKVTVIGAISIDKVLGVMTMNDSMDSNAFNVFIEKVLAPQLWPGAVVMMDNLSAHKIDEITPIIKSVGASVINISPYSPDFNPIEHWWSQLKSFIKTFSPRTAEMVDVLIAVALHLVNSQHLRNWFANCCYCTS